MRALLLVVFWLGSLILVTGAGGATAQNETVASWEKLGNEVYHMPGASGTGHRRMFVGYAGYAVTDAWSQAWVKTIWDKALSPLPHTAAFTDIYAVGGPTDPGYQNKNIANWAIVKDMQKRLSFGQHLLDVVIVGHSSGTFVAHEFLQHLLSLGRSPFSGRVYYFNLDGGQSGMNATIIEKVTARCFFVWAHDTRTGTRSPNWESMVAQQERYGHLGKTQLHVWDAGRSGCDSGAIWCVHVTLINQKPWKPSGGTLPDDYVDFVPPHLLNDFWLHLLPPTA